MTVIKSEFANQIKKLNCRKSDREFCLIRANEKKESHPVGDREILCTDIDRDEVEGYELSYRSLGCSID